ncbi:hypothetical protein GH714_011332 [Hevea brasiliensis]|uniref:Reverse transcriptase zinc-binding domain-containing protein n=1 Tax=Hevea brasiliensis TaxID=3981 RepID=A0A6A6NGI8_HEVBR|nr:hypothetical protein GH714_011332 [Hevea brasiliensis]
MKPPSVVGLEDAVFWGFTKNGLFSVKRHLTMEDSCPFCLIHRESLMHVLRDCVWLKNCLYSSWLLTFISLFAEDDVQKWLVSNLDNRKDAVEGLHWNFIFPTTCWYLRKWRNAALFDDSFVRPSNTKQLILAFVREFVSANRILGTLGNARVGRVTKLVGWSPPTEGWCVVNTGGSFNVNGRLAAAGGLIRSHTGSWMVVLMLTLVAALL